MGDESIQVHHLLFADDTMFFSAHEEEMVQNLSNLIGFFEDASSLNVNKQKSEVIGIHCNNQWTAYLSNKHGCKLGE